MKYDFDKTIKRINTGSIKWEFVDKIYSGKDLLPMWVADMDFEVPEPVIEAVEKIALQGIYGYSNCMDSYYDAAVKWFGKRHKWEINRDWIIFCPGVVTALNTIVQGFTEPGDKIIIQPPVYHPFRGAVINNKRILINNPLILNGGRYEIDFDDLKEKARDARAKLLILSNPHNPVGRVWTIDELKRLGEICISNNVLIVSDEIHCDLILKGKKHVPLASISDDFLGNSLTCIAPSKTFNLAGLQTSNVIISDPGKRISFQKILDRNGIHNPNIFGPIALEAAYNYGEEWLTQLLEYIYDNFIFLKEFISTNIPEIKIIEPEATYLVWLDFRAISDDPQILKKILLEKAKVALNDGSVFGRPEGDGFQRMNTACPRTVLKEGLKRIEFGIKDYRLNRAI